MKMFTYVVKPGESARMIAAKFGMSESDIINANRHIPRKTVVYMGKPYIIFSDLRIGQKLIIPLQNKRRMGISGIGVGSSGYGEYCDNFPINWCEGDYKCVNNVCVTEQTVDSGPNPMTDCLDSGGTWDASTGTCKAVTVIDTAIDKMNCQSAGGTWDGYACTMYEPPPDEGPPVKETKMPGAACTADSECYPGVCKNWICQLTEEQGGGKDCVNPDVISYVQKSLGVEETGEWNAESTKALVASGKTFNDIIPCYEPEPLPVAEEIPPKEIPCAKGYKLNPQKTACVPTGGDGLVKIKEEDEDKKEPKSEFPWGWVIAGVVVVAGGGAIAYYAMKDDKSKKIGAATTSSIPSKPLETSPAMAGEHRRFVRARCY